VLFPSVPAFPKLATALIDLLRIVASWVSAIPFASVDVPRPHACALAAFSGVVLSILLSGNHAWSGVRVATFAIAVLGVIVADRPDPGLYQLPAGRGAATLLVGREAAVLVDAGPESARVAEHLLKLGIGTLDLVVLTHDHADHVGGLAQVLARVHVLEVARAWSAGSSFEKGGLRLAAVWPPPGFDAGDNDRSLALEARIDGFRALLLGDLERPGLEGLLRALALEREDAVLLPHHGSENGALCDLLVRTRPRAVILSARAGFPAEETLRLLATLPVEIRATYREGLISVPAGRR
jgi:competence protein ComEC